MAENDPGARIGLGQGAGQGQGLILALILSVAMLAASGLTLVWLNIERTKLAYRVRTLEHEAAQALDLNAKLAVEREYLLSPHQLRQKARALGLGAAKPGQLRRMETGASPRDKEQLQQP